MKSQRALDEIAGEDYWKRIIELHRQGEITVFDAEAQFAVDLFVKTWFLVFYGGTSNSAGVLYPSAWWGRRAL